MLDNQEGGLLSESGRSEDIIYTDHQACLFSAETKFVACKFIWGISGNRLITHIAPRAPRITMTKLGWRVLDNMGKSPCGTVNSEQDLEPFKFLYVLHSVRRSPPSTCLVQYVPLPLLYETSLVGDQEHYRLISGGVELARYSYLATGVGEEGI
jgi:hypothetical protein